MAAHGSTWGLFQTMPERLFVCLPLTWTTMTAQQLSHALFSLAWLCYVAHILSCIQIGCCQV